MTIIKYTIAVTLWVFSWTYAHAQDGNQSGVEKNEAKKESVIAGEKEALRKTVSQITKEVASGKITSQEAEQLKQEAARKHALNIENKIAILDNRFALITRNEEETKKRASVTITFGNNNDDDDDEVLFGIEEDDSLHRFRKRDIRTISSVVFAFGLNNTIAAGRSLDDSPYKIGGSRFAEIGFGWTTRVFKERNWLRVKYGVSFQFNGLKPMDNQYFVEDGNQTNLETFPLDLDKSKLRLTNLVVPLHFEFGPSKKMEKEDYFRYDTDRSFKVGLGGYAGLNLGSIQKLKYTNDNGEDIKEKRKDDYNANSFIYGLSGYVGYGDMSLYVKYDLNPIFENNIIEERNVSLGLRWDWQ